jgi:hypothetical protein
MFNVTPTMNVRIKLRKMFVKPKRILPNSVALNSDDAI